MKPAYCVQWRSASMAAPGFWYYASEEQAYDVYNRLLSSGTAADAPRACQVPDSTPLGLDVLMRRKEQAIRA